VQAFAHLNSSHAVPAALRIRRMSGVIGVAGLTADYPAAPLGTFVLAALPEQDLKPADNQTVGERTQVRESVLAYRQGGGCAALMSNN
jgi:hypothetical protein